MTRFPTLIAMLGALVLVAASPALAAPPGSADDQYTETLPGAGGDKPSGDYKPDPSADEGGGSGGGVPAETLRELESLGADGAQAAALAQAASQRTSLNGDGSPADSARSGANAPAANIDLSPEDTGGGLGEVISAVTGGSDDSGMGFVLPLLLAVSLVGAIAFALTRRRGSDSPA